MNGKNDRFYAYERNEKMSEGSTNDWKTFNDLKVTATFQKRRNIPLVFVLHNDNKEYTFLNFSDSLLEPGVKGPQLTRVRQSTVFFVDDNYNASKSNFGFSEDPLNTLLDVRAAITLPNQLVFMGSKKYCTINFKEKVYEKEVFLVKITNIAMN